MMEGRYGDSYVPNLNQSELNTINQSQNSSPLFHKSISLYQKLLDLKEESKFHISFEALDESQFVDSQFFVVTMNTPKYLKSRIPPYHNFVRTNELINFQKRVSTFKYGQEQKLEEIPILQELEFDVNNIPDLLNKVQSWIKLGVSGFILDNSFEEETVIEKRRVLFPIKTFKNVLKEVRDFCVKSGLYPLLLVRTYGVEANLLEYISEKEDYEMVLGTTVEMEGYKEAFKKMEDGIYAGNMLAKNIVSEWIFNSNPNKFKDTLFEHWHRKLGKDEANKLISGLEKDKKTDFESLKNYIADTISDDFFWDMEKCRTIKGYYHISTDVDNVNNIMSRIAPYCDGFIYTNYGQPDFAFQSAHARNLKKHHPKHLFSYQYSNLDPYHLCKQANVKTLVECVDTLNKCGIHWQMISWNKDVESSIFGDINLRLGFSHLVSQAVGLLKEGILLFKYEKKPNPEEERLIKDNVEKELQIIKAARKQFLPHLVGNFNYFDQPFNY